MFILKRQKIISNLCACTSFRELSNRIDPGTRRRHKFLHDSNNAEAESDALDYEADFEHVNRMHKQHEQEMEIFKDKLQYDIVKRKYFKKNYPNFLTWHDKQQIRILHAKDPEEWNVIKLSEGFPALPDKIIRSNWTMKNVAKIENHDATVRENWRKFKNAEYEDLPEALRDHLKKFTDREISFYEYKNEEADGTSFEVTPLPGGFSEIISSYEELKNKNKKNDGTKSTKINMELQLHKPKNDEDTYILGEIKNKKLTTLGALKNTLERKVDEGKYISDTELSIVEVDMTKDDPPEKPLVNDMDLVKYNTGKIMVVDGKKSSDYSHLVYPEKISIPKKILKRGYTYKLNDCYYDSDGRFLYRVPGMY